MIGYDEELGEWFCTVCDATLDHGDQDDHEACPGPYYSTGGH